MFTGLIRAVGTIKAAEAFGGGRRLSIDLADLASPAPAIGASIAVSGVCLTVTAVAGPVATFEAVTETIGRSNLATARPGTRVNLEPALKIGDALDGHIVQGHVDDTATLLSSERRPESVILWFSLPTALAGLVAEKGSAAVDGISLTVVDALADRFAVSIIPQTLKDTTLGLLRPGDAANLEVDVLARYAARWLAFGTPSGGLTLDALRRNGFA